MKTKKVDAPLKVPCLFLNKVLAIKYLNARQLGTIINKLKKFIRNSKPGNVDILRFIKFVVLDVLTNEEKKATDKLLSSFDAAEVQQATIAQNIITAIYASIIEIYPQLRIESICGDVNGFDSMIAQQKNRNVSSDREFEEYLEKQTTKKAKKRKEITTLKDILSLEASLKSNIIGQDEAVEVVCNALKLKLAGFSDRLALFFIGKTGRGKTQLAKLLADSYCANYFWKVDCAEYSNGHEMNKFMGAPPGYVGHVAKSVIAEKAEKSKRWVILFDEVEKANDKLINFLLALVEDGICYDNTGVRIDLSESLFIFTSNCGLKELKASTTNFHKSSTKESDKEELLKSLEKQFSPEFRNRIDEYVFFNDLNREDAEKIVKLNLKKYPVKLTPELVKYFVDNGFSDEFGARSILRCIKKRLLVPLSETILSDKMPQDGTINFDAIVSEGLIKIVNTEDA